MKASRHSKRCAYREDTCDRILEAMKATVSSDLKTLVFEGGVAYVVITLLKDQGSFNVTILIRSCTQKG